MPGSRILVAETGPTAAPYTYTVPGSQVIQPRSVSAVFDGSAVGDAFLPCLSFYGQHGELIGRTFPGSPVAAGDSAEVTFAPFLREAGGDGIRYNTHNYGEWLSITTFGAGPSGLAMELINVGDAGILVAADGNGPVLVKANGDGGLQLESNGDGQLKIAQTGNGGILIHDSGTGPGITIEQTDVGSPIRIFASGGPIRLELADGDVILEPGGSGTLQPNLPTADPGVPGALWNGGGTVKVSP